MAESEVLKIVAICIGIFLVLSGTTLTIFAKHAAASVGGTQPLLYPKRMQERSGTRFTPLYMRVLGIGQVVFGCVILAIAITGTFHTG